jgi:hypothetical protein
MSVFVKQLSGNIEHRLKAKYRAITLIHIIKIMVTVRSKISDYD